MSSHSKKKFENFIAILFIIFLIVGFFIWDYFHKIKIQNLEVNKPALVLDTIKEFKFPDLLGKAESSYAGGTEGRHKNIELGVARMSGKILLPGEEFSFKDTLGTTTEADGFTVQRVFLNGEVTKGIGGGLCQVSTALFRAVLSSGLSVTERSNHSFTVSLYDVGLDATYSDPGPDFKFKNDTANPIVIKGRTENLKAIFEIYGVKDGRIASTTEPEIVDIVNILPTRYVYTPILEEGVSECVNTPQIGYTAKIGYNVLYPNGEYKNHEFVSRYRPLQRICYIVGDKIKSFDINKVLINR